MGRRQTVHTGNPSFKISMNFIVVDTQPLWFWPTLQHILPKEKTQVPRGIQMTSKEGEVLVQSFCLQFTGITSYKAALPSNCKISLFLSGCAC